MNHWVLKSVDDDDLSYISNDGHADELQTKYVYDNFVPNCRQIKKGDVAVIVNKEKVLGLAKISNIVIYNSTKIRRRCPVCNNTNYEERKTKLPKYRCNKGHEFEEPLAETVDVIQYEAFYSQSFISPKIKVTVDKLRSYHDKGYNRNMSMQSLSKDFFMDYFESEYNYLLHEVSYPLAEDGDNNLLGEILSDDYVPTGEDERSKIYKSIIQRRGQQKFRDAVREMYGDKCVITGCEILDILEAAHINPYKGEKDNHPTNGLLLRADIHTLFDLDLIGIEPNELKVYVKETVRKDGYEDLQDKLLITQSKFPSKESLNMRWNKFIESK
ncbi:HNH endonuclease [Flavobacterium sp. TBRC 19031]|uniref:HNH endonuclease n=1 Tax=Flavobacterium mekongense TaxID=3379707 RepID=UPI0039998789